jgi:hypothetical protein
MRVIDESLRKCGSDLSQVCLQHVLTTHAIELPGLRFQLGTAQHPQRSFVEMTFQDQEGRFRR